MTLEDLIDVLENRTGCSFELKSAQLVGTYDEVIETRCGDLPTETRLSSRLASVMEVGEYGLTDVVGTHSRYLDPIERHELRVALEEVA